MAVQDKGFQSCELTKGEIYDDKVEAASRGDVRI